MRSQLPLPFASYFASQSRIHPSPETPPPPTSERAKKRRNMEGGKEQVGGEQTFLFRRKFNMSDMTAGGRYVGERERERERERNIDIDIDIFGSFIGSQKESNHVHCKSKS